MRSSIKMSRFRGRFTSWTWMGKRRGYFWNPVSLRILKKALSTIQRVFIGEMLLYESLRIVHGRPEPLRGKFFDNIFVHFKPAKIWYKKDDPRMLSQPLTRADLLWERLFSHSTMDSKIQNKRVTSGHFCAVYEIRFHSSFPFSLKYSSFLHGLPSVGWSGFSCISVRKCVSLLWLLTVCTLLHFFLAQYPWTRCRLFCVWPYWTFLSYAARSRCHDPMAASRRGLGRRNEKDIFGTGWVLKSQKRARWTMYVVRIFRWNAVLRKSADCSR